jgi:hypothetical protein
MPFSLPRWSIAGFAEATMGRLKIRAARKTTAMILLEVFAVALIVR